MTREEVRAWLADNRRTVGWLALELGRDPRTVAKWLRDRNPHDPSDPRVWDEITSVCERNSKGAAPPELTQAKIVDDALDLAMEVLHGDQDKAKDLAKTLIQETVFQYKTRRA